MSVKHRVRNYIVPRLGAASPAVDGTQLYNTTTDNLNLAVGAFALYESVAGSGNPTSVVAAATAANTPDFQFIMRRDKSMDTNPLYERTLEKSIIYNPNMKLTWRGTAAALRNNHVGLVGAPVGQPGQVPIYNETEYIVNGSLKGWHNDLYNGESRVLYMGRFTTPDYTASTIYTTVAQQVDHILMNVAFDFNNQVSGQQIMAFCIDSTGTIVPNANNQASLMSALAVASVGDNVTIGFKDDGQVIRLTLDADLINTFAALNTALPVGSVLVPYARPTAANMLIVGRLVAGGSAAGDPNAVVDHLGFLTLDLKRSAYHEVKNRKERCLIGVDGGFDATTAVDTAFIDASEGSGFGKELKFEYASFLGHREYPGGKPWQPNYVAFYNEIKEDGWYDIYILTSDTDDFATSGMPSVNPQVLVVALLNRTLGSTTTNPYYTGVVNPQKTYLETRMNSMAANGYPFSAVSI